MQLIERGGETNSGSPMWWRASFCQTTADKPYAVTPIEPLARPAQVGLAQLDQEMIVIVHQHEGVQTDLETADPLGQQLAEVLPVPVVSEDRPPLIAPPGHMIPASYSLNSQWPCHGRDLASRGSPKS